MKQEEMLLEAMGAISSDLIEEAVPEKEIRGFVRWKRWGALVACLCLVTVGAYSWKEQHTWQELNQQFTPSVIQEESNTMISPQTGPEVQIQSTVGTTAETEAYGFTMEEENIVYFPISFHQRVRFGLVPEGAIGLTKENIYRITKNDLGAVMGTVKHCQDHRLIGSTVYHFAAFPELDAICIVERNGTYAFYVADGLVLSDKIGENSNRILDAYRMPDSVTRITIQNGDWETLLTITDEETIFAICDLLRDKKNIGLQAHERRFAKLWKDTYANEDVFYDGDTMHYNDLGENWDTYDKAHALWNEGERVVWFTTERGFEFYMIYKPSIQTFSMYGYYAMEPDEVEAMNTLLQI